MTSASALSRDERLEAARRLQTVAGAASVHSFLRAPSFRRARREFFGGLVNEGWLPWQIAQQFGVQTSEVPTLAEAQRTKAPAVVLVPPAKANAERGRERMRKLHADPDFAKANAERMRKLHADPDFAKANAERGRERMRKLHADPDFAKAHAERMRKLHVDPDFAKAHAEASRNKRCRLCGQAGHYAKTCPNWRGSR